MPIYEYQCESCEKLVEKWQKFSDAPLETCPSCNGKMHKIISESSFHLKGSGWYVTDYAGKKQTTPATRKPDASSPAGSECAQGSKKEGSSKSSDA
jgi:putative FmdB family regulatory protein